MWTNLETAIQVTVEEKTNIRILMHVCTIWKNDAGSLFASNSVLTLSAWRCHGKSWRHLCFWPTGYRLNIAAPLTFLFCVEHSCKFRLSAVLLTEQPQTRGSRLCVLRLDYSLGVFQNSGNLLLSGWPIYYKDVKEHDSAFCFSPLA